MLQPTKSIQKGLKEFTKKQCEMALKLYNEGKSTKEIVTIVLPKKVSQMSSAQIKTYGLRLITTGRYLKYSFTKKNINNGKIFNSILFTQILIIFCGISYLFH